MRGKNQLPLRWNTVIFPTSGAMAGTNCTALAPVPTTATRLPCRSTSWSQRAECIVGPAKSSAPGIGGIAGVFSWPVASTTASACQLRPSCASTVQVIVASSSRTVDTSTDGSNTSSSPYSFATPWRYSRISGCGEHSRDQSLRWANENEYRWLGTSHAAPG